ncbi:hypothetical protein [Bifidobacterium animalis]|uniref:hypothetical protein n=1 Tax=Bifidobacterium animalis TaxID=28025 RepID=UPI00101FC4A5|nr:hypothetical protein [Bifidobacterium animalis]
MKYLSQTHPQILVASISNPSVLIFAILGFFAMPAYSFWYKGNSMCGTALGMACNGTYAFREPFFIWLLLGAFNVGGMSADYPPAWCCAVDWRLGHDTWHFYYFGKSAIALQEK